MVLGETELSVLRLYDLENRMQLFVCICALEKHIDGHVIEAKNMGRFLRGHFRQHPL